MHKYNNNSYLRINAIVSLRSFALKWQGSSQHFKLGTVIEASGFALASLFTDDTIREVCIQHCCTVTAHTVKPNLSQRAHSYVTLFPVSEFILRLGYAVDI